MTRERGDLQRVGEVLAGVGIEAPRDVGSLEQAWVEAAGPDTARHTQLRSLKRGRLVVATSSSVWAQTLQMMEARLRAGLEARLGSGVVREIVFRPAGWDPGAEAGAPRPLGVAPAARGEGDQGRRAPASAAPRALTEAESRAVEEVRRAACSPELGAAIAGAMRAALARNPQE